MLILQHSGFDKKIRMLSELWLLLIVSVVMNSLVFLPLSESSDYHNFVIKRIWEVLDDSLHYRYKQWFLQIKREWREEIIEK